MMNLKILCKTKSNWWWIHLSISEDESKVGFLRGFPHADTRLLLFEANIYKSDEFWPAIQGCEFVFHVATPYQHQTDSQVHFSNILSLVFFLFLCVYIYTRNV
jgi:hypothetical protein